MAWPVRFPGTLVQVTLAALIPLGAACGGTDAPADHSQTQSQAIVEPETFYDGAFGVKPTQCTVGGVSMHCCPGGTFMIGARIDQNVFKCATIGGFNTGLMGDIFLDPPAGQPAKQCVDSNGLSMHCCPQNQGNATVMVGLRADENILACQQIRNDFVGRDSLAVFDPNPGNSPTQDAYPMHVCPPPPPNQTSYGMAGIRIDHNEFVCVN
jgi:hypothetical protein